MIAKKMGPIDVASIDPPEKASLISIIPLAAAGSTYDAVSHMRVLKTLLDLSRGDDFVGVLDEMVIAIDRSRREIVEAQHAAI